MRVKLIICGCLFAIGVSGVSASDMSAEAWVAQCAATEELYGWCAATVSEVVKLVDNYHSEYPHVIVCWQTRPPPSIGDLPTTAQIFWFRELVSATVRYLRDHPSEAKAPASAVMLAAFMRQWPCGGVAK